MSNEPSLACRRPGQGVRVDVREMELGSTEHREHAVGIDGSPREIDEPVAATTLGERPTYVDPTIRRRADGELEVLVGSRRVARNQPERLPCPRQRHMHVPIAGRSVRRGARRAGKSTPSIRTSTLPPSPPVAHESSTHTTPPTGGSARPRSRTRRPTTSWASDGWTGTTPRDPRSPLRQSGSLNAISRTCSEHHPMVLRPRWSGSRTGAISSGVWHRPHPHGTGERA